MARKSDYLDPRTNLYRLLPEVFQSQTNEAVFEDVFNRYLSKPQIELVDGFAGAPLDNATQERQITEPTPHRQLFQLQPLLFAQVGSTDHLASYVDILNEIERYGIDSCRLPLWGNALAFNWAPPIDIDKLVNYRNYYWYDADDPTSDPQYITIENPCIDATQRVEAYEETTDTFGDLQTIIGLGTNQFVIEGDLSEVFTDGYVFFVTGSTNTDINLTYFTTASSTYDVSLDRTTITVDESITDTSTVDGAISLNVYLSFLQAQQNCACGNDVGWDFALWDDNQVGSVLWSESLLTSISQPDEATWASNNPGSLTGSPAALPPADLSLWYDTTNNQLKQYYSGAWNVVQNNFSAIVAQIEGTHFWDYTVTCDLESNMWTDQNKWYHQNHVPNFAIAKRAELPIIEYDFSAQLNRWTFTDYVWQYRESNAFEFAVPAGSPITTNKPTLNELIPFNYVINSVGVGSPVINKVTLSPEYGDQTDVFINGYNFEIQGDTLDAANNAIYIVESSEYTTTDVTAGNELATVVTVQGTFSSANQSQTTTATCSPITTGSGGQIIPYVTSQGDFWQGYHEHWLLDDSTPGVEPATGKLLPVPSPPPEENPFIGIDYLQPPIEIDNVGEYLTSTPVDLCEFGSDPYVLTMQYTVVPSIAPGGVPAGTVIPLDSRMISRAPIGESLIRVVHNDQQVYGTFTELDTGIGGSPIYVGSPVAFGSPRVGVNDGFVDSITLSFDLEEFDTLLITVAEQAVSDIGWSAIPVRTVADDAEFNSLLLGSPQTLDYGSPTRQPETVSLVQYRKINPLKTETNEYPLFDLFDCEGNPRYEASELFKWRTSQDEELNGDINLRIVGSSTADWEFENLLIDPDTLPRPTLYTYKDATLDYLTVWRKGLNDEEYVPSYLDENGNAITVGDPDGAWEVPDQLYFNAEHENRQYLAFPEFITHFRTILDAQSDFPGVILSGSQAYLQTDYNFGLGGRIKEHNDSYDTFLSSAFVNNVSPLGIIDFAHDQYEASLNTIKELYRRNLLTYLTNTSEDSIFNLQGVINQAVISSYELNDFFDTVYGDTNAFIAGSPELGVRNWPATLPFVGLGYKFQPHTYEDHVLSLHGLVHHDGHRSTPSLTNTTRESVIQILLNTPDSRVEGETFGVQQSTTPPDLYSELAQFITPRAGIYWYYVSGGTRTLYRFEVSSVAATPPAGATIGALWYDTNTNLLKQLQSTLLWEPVEGSPSEEIITQGWTEIDFNNLLVDLLLEVEQRLYEAAPTLTALDFDINSIQTSDISCPTADTTVTEADTADTYFQEAFSSFLRDVNIDEPYSAEQWYVASDAFTWNYSASTVTTYPRTGSPSGSVVGGWWTQVYQELYGTPYPHLEPWVLQGYTGKPTWWDDEYLNDDPATYGTRRWKYIHTTSSPSGGMWLNILDGIVPAGRTLPNGATSTGNPGEAQTWNYLSVNIDNVTLDGFDPDEILPPYWDYVSNGGSSTVRSVFSDLAGEIVLPNADYTFDTGGPIKFLWETSSQRLYDDLTVGFRMQPVRFMHSTFGVNFVEAGGLQINQADCKVYSHRDVLFHGDIVNTNEVVIVDGINQWYVNYNRFNGYDVSASDFRPLWQDWQPQLSYQFGSIIDTETLQISNSNFDITERDYRIILKKSAGIDNFYLDAFNVRVLSSPNKLARYDTQHLYNFQVDTFFPTTRSLSYYEVHNYPVYVDDLNNTFKVYCFNIVDVDTDGVFYLEGDQTAAFTSSQDFTVGGSTANNGSYTATNISYNANTDKTSVIVAGSLDATVDGYLTTSYRTIPWETGDRVELTSTRTVPGPLVANVEYFIIKIDDTTFQLASTYSDALARRNINLLSEGAGVVHVGQILNKFTALEGKATNRVWNHYVLDTRFTRSFVPPQRVTGVQNLINVVDGYAKITEEEGWIVNLDAFEADPDTNLPISWNVEIERFIDQAYRLPQQRAAVPDTYPVSVDPIADTFTFGSEAPEWQTGTKVSFSPGTGSLPTPLVTNTTYYAIILDDSTIQVAQTSSDALLGIPLNIIGGGSASISVLQTPTPIDRSPSLEINPFRNNLWLETPQGVLSNVVDGPTDDVRNTQLITDQRREQLTGRDVSVFRWDRVARIYIPSELPNPDVAPRDTTPYNTLHMASVQAFVDGYESIIMFNDYATDNTLIYDPFIGLNQARFFLQFFRQDEFTQRPAIGGYFLTPDDQILRNIESNVLDMQTLYDTNVVLETTNIIEEGRRTLGYLPSEQTFLDELGLNPKSKFLFWRGMIQNKGTVNSINAFTNNVNLEGAIVDEYWAYKLADFGSNYEQEYPALNLIIDDSRRADKRFEFLQPGETAASTFEGILLTNQDRWYKQPDVLEQLEDNDSSFYFNAEIQTVESFNTATGNAGSPQRFYIETSVPFDDIVVLPIDEDGNQVGSPFVEPTYRKINSQLIEFEQDPTQILADDVFVVGQSLTPTVPSDAQQWRYTGSPLTWTGGSPTTAMRNLAGVTGVGVRSGLAYNGNGVWVSVGSNWTANPSFSGLGSPHAIVFRSTDDGVSWTPISTPNIFDSGSRTSLSDVAYGNGLFVATGIQGSIFTSPDGITWTDRSVGVTTFFRSVNWNGTEFVTGGYGTGSPKQATVWVSSNGINWEQRGVDTSAYYPDGFYVIGTTLNSTRWFGGTSNDGHVFVSDDRGATWTQQTTSLTQFDDAIRDFATDNNNTVVACGLGLGSQPGAVIYSTDNGDTWNRIIGSPTVPNYWGDRVIYVPNLGFVLGGWDAKTSSSAIWTSTDGANWTMEAISDGPSASIITALASKTNEGTREFRVYTVGPKFDAQNPAKIIDIKDQYVVNELPFWDPRRGQQYAVANNQITLETDTDPASYTNSLDDTWIDSQFWNVPEVGTIWWDTSEREYRPYFDPEIYNLESRLENWGKLSDWSTVKLYQWTESDIPPSEYDARAAIEELDTSIDPLIRKTGRAKVEVFQRERFELDIVEVYPSTANTGSPQFPVNTIVVDDSSRVLSVGDRVVFTSDDSLPLPLTAGTFYYIVSLNRSSFSAATTEIQVSLTEGGSVLDIKPGSVLIDINGDIGSPLDQDISNNPTGLINDFDTSGIQTVQFSSSKSLASSTGLTLGTQGYQEVFFSSAIATGTSTGLDNGSGGSQTIYSWGGAGSPNVCSDATGLTPGVWYSITVSIDGGAGQIVYLYGTTVTDFSIAAGLIDTRLGILGSATCTPGVGIVVESNSTGPGSSISITDGGYGLGFISATGSLLSAASPGTDPASYDATITIDGNPQTLDINGGSAQTFGALVLQMNSQLTGANVTIPGGVLRVTSNTTGTGSTVGITDGDLFASMPLFTGYVGSPIQSTVGGTSVLYTTLVAVDGGGQQTVTLTGDEAQTINELITLLNTNLAGVTVSLFNGDLRFQSNSTGSNSTVDILEVGSPPGLLYNLASVIFPFSTPVDGLDATEYTTEIDIENGPRLVTIIGNTAQTWDELLDEFNSQLPSGVLSYQLDTGSPVTTGVNLLLDAGTNTVTISNDNLFTRLGATSLGSPANTNTNGLFFNEFIPQDTGNGSHVLVPPFADEDWVQLKAVTKNLFAARDYQPGSPLLFDATVESGSPIIQELSILGGGDDTVDVYVNGALKRSDVSIPASGLIGISGTRPQDFITIRKERHTLTEEQAAFNPDVFDDGTNLIQYKEDYNYSEVTRLNELSEQETYYYFWVEDKTVRDRQGNATLRQATLDLTSIPTPYMIADNLQPRLFGAGSPLTEDAPRRYTQLILRGLAGVVDDQDRYILRFTRDFTLRDDLRTRNYTTDLTADYLKVGTEPLDLKTLHTEWTLIRERQPFNIPRALWDKVTEAMIAVSLTDSSSRVPSLSRELYDINYNLMTRYGLGDGQAFGDGSLFLATLLDDLQDPNNDFSPVDINTFFAANDFTTEEGITEAMDSIYNSFPFEAVNRIFFKFVKDALTTQPEFAGFFKTSWVALQGTQVFQTEELFTG